MQKTPEKIDSVYQERAIENTSESIEDPEVFFWLLDISLAFLNVVPFVYPCLGNTSTEGKVVLWTPYGSLLISNEDKTR